MKIGDIVRGRTESWAGDIPYGIILDRSPRTNTWGDEEHRWWFIMLFGGIIFEDAEKVWEVVDEKPTSR